MSDEVRRLLVREWPEHKRFIGYGRPSRRHRTEHGGWRCLRCGIPEGANSWPPFKGLPPCRTTTLLGKLVVVLLMRKALTR